MIISELVTNKKSITAFKTLEERFNKKHNFKYCYNKAVYLNKIEKIIINCPEHGEFKQQPDNHMNGAGCPKCGNNKTSLLKKENTKIFITKAIKKHGTRYNYKKVKYTLSSNNIIIICKEHGEFLQKPSKHLFGQGCPKCASPFKNMLHKEFIEESNKKHNYIYTYGEDYTNSSSKTNIFCKEHGEFHQVASAHVRGQCCPKCADKIRINKTRETYKDKPTILYYIQVNNLYKIGLRVIDDNYKDIESNIINGRYSKERNYYNIKVLKVKIFDDGSEAYDTEQQILGTFHNYKYIGEDMKKFGGYTELFEFDIRDKLTI